MSKVFTIGGNTVSYGGFLLRELGEGSLTISKTVTGTGFDPAKTFELTVTFDRPVTYNGTTSTTHTFNLAHGQSVTITDIPEGTSYTAAETPLSPGDIAAGYTISGMTGGSGVIRNGVGAAAVASNAFAPAVPTFRFRFSASSYDPSVSFITDSSHTYTWTRVSSSPNVWDCQVAARWSSTPSYLIGAFEGVNGRHFSQYPSNQTIVLVDANLCGYAEEADSLFEGCGQLSAIESFRGTSNVTSFGHAFAETSITSCPLFDTSACENFSFMFSWCRSLTSSPLFNTSAGTAFDAMFNSCDNLQAVPRLSMPNAETVTYMFNECPRVASGALALYQDLAALPALSDAFTHTGCFDNCGVNTTTGAAELAQIPSGWK